MKVVILTGGHGSQLSDETEDLPKALVPIGELPLIWHVMRRCAHFGLQDFIVTLGRRGQLIERFAEATMSVPGGLRIDYAARQMTQVAPGPEGWRVDLTETGLTTPTGTCLKHLADRVGRERFFLSYGDALADVDLEALLRFHDDHGRLATLVTVRPPARFGHLQLDGDAVTVFDEKPPAAEGWINGRFFILEPEVLEYIEGNGVFDARPLSQLAAEGQLMAYRHAGFWQCLDTLHDKRLLKRLWQSGEAPWKIWN